MSQKIQTPKHSSESTHSEMEDSLRGIGASEKEVALKKAVKYLTILILILMAILVINIFQIHNYQTITGGEYITRADCEQLINPSPIVTRDINTELTKDITNNNVKGIRATMIK